MTFAQMKKMQPELAALEKKTLEFRRTRCTIGYWYSDIKPRLVKLVGWHLPKGDPLSTERAYDIAYQHLYSFLPDCPEALQCGDCIDDESTID